jgi:hypothetical protein
VFDLTIKELRMTERWNCNGRRCKKLGQTLSCWKGLIKMEEDAQNNGQTLSCWKGLIAMEEDAQKHGQAL